MKSYLWKSRKKKNFKGAWNLPFKVTKEFASGMPWESEDHKKRSRVPILAKHVFQILVAKEDSDRLDYLLHELKASKKLHEIYGPTAFTVKVPTYEQKTEQTKYLQMMSTHIAVH